MATLLSAFVAPPCVVIGKQKKSSLLAFQLQQQQQQHPSLNGAVGTTTTPTTYSTRKLGIVRCWGSCNAKYESNNVCGEFKVMFVVVGFCVFKSSFFPCVIESVVVIVVIFLNVSSGAFLLLLLTE
jgi:hypothetical protein